VGDALGPLVNVQLTDRERRVRRVGILWGFIGTVVVATVALVVYGATL
jgi:hypothetical protein